MATRAEYQRRLDALKAEEEADPKPAGDFPPEQEEWQRRRWQRQSKMNELIQAMGFRSYDDDVCPLDADGLEAYLAWLSRRNQRDKAIG